LGECAELDAQRALNSNRECAANLILIRLPDQFESFEVLGER
jgi:hypothetical protein